MSDLKRRKGGDCASEKRIYRTLSFSGYQILYTRFCPLGHCKREIGKVTGFGLAYGCTQLDVRQNISKTKYFTIRTFIFI